MISTQRDAKLRNGQIELRPHCWSTWIHMLYSELLDYMNHLHHQFFFFLKFCFNEISLQLRVLANILCPLRSWLSLTSPGSPPRLLWLPVSFSSQCQLCLGFHNILYYSCIYLSEYSLTTPWLLLAPSFWRAGTLSDNFSYAPTSSGHFQSCHLWSNHQWLNDRGPSCSRMFRHCPS